MVLKLSFLGTLFLLVLVLPICTSVAEPGPSAEDLLIFSLSWLDSYHRPADLLLLLEGHYQPPTPTPTRTSTLTQTSTRTATFTRTLHFTRTPTPTVTINMTFPPFDVQPGR